MNTATREVSVSVPVRRTRWVSFWVGVAAVVAAAVSAVLLVGALFALLSWLEVEVDGFWIIFLFGLLWFALFFLSYPLQRRYARSRDLRRPGISFIDGRLAVPVAQGSTMHFKLDEPHELVFGWWEHVMTSASYQGAHTRAVWTHARLTQAGQQLFLIAEDAVREAQSAGWPKTPDSSTPTMPCANLWASDLVVLVEAMRARPARADHRPHREII
ncbi:MAG TPA: hypothetical protein VEY11_04900 [Pyrinomonadaceae bacterium]|nr:hypothetical protein [Pyrinomonadaceae bacterium]